MSAILSLSATDLDEDTLQDLTRRLCRGLRDEFGVNAELATQLPAIGAKKADDLRGDDMSKLTQMIIEAVEGMK